MRDNRILIVAALVFCLVVAGSLVWRRFDFPSEMPVRVIASKGSTFLTGDTFKRGQIIETKNSEYLAVKIGDSLKIVLDERTNLELDRLFEDELTLRFTRGRIVVDSRGTTPVLIETNKTQSIIEQGSAAFINYDFQKLVTVAPMEGSVQTHIKGTDDYLLLPVPINISEIESPTFSKTMFDPKQGAGAMFHAWADEILHQ